MNKKLFPSLSQDNIFKLENPIPDLNVQVPYKSISPRPLLDLITDTPTTSSIDLAGKLVYVNNTKKNPLTSMPLFKNIIDDSIKSKLAIGSTKDLLNFYKIRAEEEIPHVTFASGPVEFNSNIESGNLFKAYHHKDNEYVLLLRTDYGNCKYTHWFYFKVKSKTTEKITFHIVNIAKKDLGLMQGQKIVVKKGDKWERGGTDIVFTENNEFKDYTNGDSGFVLSFSYVFDDKKEISLAYSFPYTYSQLAEWIHLIKHMHHDICTVSTLSHTLAGTPCELLTITSEISSYMDMKKNQISEKKAIIFMGRVHPSESPSWCQIWKQSMFFIRNWLK